MRRVLRRTWAPVLSSLRRIEPQVALSRVVLVGDRGMLTEARIREEVKPAGLEWITALRAPAIRKLASSGTLQPSLFDERDLAEIHHPDFPGERLIACRNPLLAVERARKREALLRATESDIDEIRKATRRDKRQLAGKDKIGLRVGKVIGRHKVAKHFDLEIADDGFAGRRNAERIAEEAALNGLYVVRTSLPERELGAEDTVRAHKGLSHIERAFRSVKTVDLKVRGPSTTTGLSAYAPTSCCACSPTMSNGTCAKSSLPSCSTRMTRPARTPRAPPSSHRRSPRPRPDARPPANTRPRERRCTASARSLMIWRPSPEIAFSRNSPEHRPSI